MTDLFDDPTLSATQTPRRGWALLWTGLGLLVLGPATAVLGTMFAMRETYRRIEESEAPTPTELAEGGHFTKTMSLIGMLAALVGLGLVITAIIRLSQSSPSARARV